MSSEINATASAGFDRAGAEYERGRPGYPPAAVAKLVAALEISPGSDVLDLAAGTGKLTRALVAAGATVVAVEPVVGMRTELIAITPEVTVLEGTAEAIPRPDSSVDAVTVAQAFHWFDAAAAGAEIHRVLRPQGWLGVIWNAWDESVPWVARVQARVHEHVEGAPQHQTSRWREVLAASGRFTASEEAAFPHIVIGPLGMLLDRISSVSYISALADAERERVREDVAAIAAEDPQTRGRAELEMPYTTTVVWYQRR